MDRSLLWGLALLTVISSIDGWKYGRYRNRYAWNALSSNCSICAVRSKSVTLRAKNVLRDPKFDISVTLNRTRSKSLFYMMEEAAAANTMFRFSVSYFGPPLGYFIDAINKVYGNYSLDSSYWEILNGKMNHSSVGVSSYIPYDGETVTFNFTRGGHS